MRMPSWSKASESESTLALPEKEFSRLGLEIEGLDDQLGSDVSLQIHPVPSKDALIIKIEPPKDPAQIIEHVPVDIVLVIDVSGSMIAQAPIPGAESSESTGLCVLDLVKHAALVIIETLNKDDRLGIVTFASKSTIVQSLMPMTDANKDEARNNIKGMRTKDATNLWHGIRDGLSLFKNGGSGSNASAIMVLTDGMPNHMCPPNGYVPKLRTLMPLPTSIYTFGFGYNLNSGLLKSIAEVGFGNYAFIPDAGMIGTVFVHAVANLQSTYATSAVLTLTSTEPLKIEETTGATVIQQPVETVVHNAEMTNKLTIPLGNIQFGQSRDIFLRISGLPSAKAIEAGEGPKSSHVRASLSLAAIGEPLGEQQGGIFGMGRRSSRVSRCVAVAQLDLHAETDLPPAEIAYHESRAKICEFLSRVFPISPNGDHRAVPGDLSSEMAELATMIETIPASKHEDMKNKSLMQDLQGDEPNGQVRLAISNAQFFHRWGGHYLLSYQNAHTRQICNSFKDPGPLQYGVDSKIFTTCRDRLDEVFDNLPAPEPSAQPAPHFHMGARSSGSVGSQVKTMSKLGSMASYNNRRAPCFAGSSLVKLSSGEDVAIKRLRRGMKVSTPAGSREVAMVLKTPVEDEVLCRIGNLIVTPWHPISTDGKTWSFPANIADQPVRYSGAVYSIMLQRDGNTDAHGIQLGDTWGVTLGHGIFSGNDIRAHKFLGNYDKVRKSLESLGVGKTGLVVGGGIRRSKRSGLIVGFKRWNGRGINA